MHAESGIVVNEIIRRILADGRTASTGVNPISDCQTTSLPTIVTGV